MFVHKWNIGSDDELSSNTTIKIIPKFAFEMKFLVGAMLIENTWKPQTAFIIIDLSFHISTGCNPVSIPH